MPGILPDSIACGPTSATSRVRHIEHAGALNSSALLTSTLSPRASSRSSEEDYLFKGKARVSLEPAYPSPRGVARVPEPPSFSASSFPAPESVRQFPQNHNTESARLGPSALLARTTHVRSSDSGDLQSVEADFLHRERGAHGMQGGAAQSAKAANGFPPSLSLLPHCSHPSASASPSLPPPPSALSCLLLQPLAT
jgi:hypothetical protein